MLQSAVGSAYFLLGFLLRDDPYWISRRNIQALIKLSSINKVSLVWVSACSNTGSIRDNPYWTSGKSGLELIELYSVKVFELNVRAKKILKSDLTFTAFLNLGGMSSGRKGGGEKGLRELPDTGT